MSRWLLGDGRRRLGAIVLVIVGLLGGYNLLGGHKLISPGRRTGGGGPGGITKITGGTPGSEAADEAGAFDGPGAAGALPVVTRAETVLRFESYYLPCRLTFSQVELAGRERSGFTEAGLAQVLASWSIQQFGDDEVVLRRDTAAPCPDSGVTFTLGIAEGKVVVYRGKPPGGEIYAATGLAAVDLLPGDRALLEQGVVLVGERQIWQYMEGLSHGADSAEP